MSIIDPTGKTVEIHAVIHLDPALSDDSVRLLAKGFEMVVDEALRGFGRTIQVTIQSKTAT